MHVEFTFCVQQRRHLLLFTRADSDLSGVDRVVRLSTLISKTTSVT